MKKRDRKLSGKRTTTSPPVKARPGVKSTAKGRVGRKSVERLKDLGTPPTIVGVGASAGGLEAFTQLLRALPLKSGMAFVLVQHLEPRHESLLTNLLTRATKMPVQEIRDGMRVEANHVYVIPANADLSLRDGTLQVVGRQAPTGHHLPVDHFLRSLAETQKSRAIGVILSGTASDGTAGLRAIKTEGGITFAQDPSSAKFDGMPRSAIASGCVDLVLPPERIAAELARIALKPISLEELPEASPAREEDWSHLFQLLRAAFGVDFTYYKKATIRRRLGRRMALHKLESLKEYLLFLESNRAELDLLFQEILIHVTSFFRDPEVFRTLRETMLPRILAGRGPREQIRIWVPGCSTGEEVYSIAICLLEYLGDRASDTPIQIFGTEIDEAAIEKARAGAYSADALRELSAARRRRFFTQVDGNYTVNAALREHCVFARHDLIKDPPFSRLDLVSCRNVLIYLEPVLQKKVLTSFHYALKPAGMLLLGRSESLGSFAKLFSTADRRNKFFTRDTRRGEPLEIA
jgi:two-component system CheB/CheR fusion protein